MYSTARLTLRAWQASDLAPFAALNQDPDVMRYFPSVLSRAQSDAMAAHIQSKLADHPLAKHVLYAISKPSWQADHAD
ncbi:GNAT family N-acetyltransferase [Salinivibrio kushneri]|uniref:GNAT family N-acetyltransferase n=1 Tax=Salinivibrio kushneri TaxID=1908198 RepID=UPI001C6426D4|nr:GNAT family N-acetyltransferase [Salinivibrio kushneri]